MDIVRLYWNVTVAGAALLMSLLTRELNRFQVPFMFKCGNHAEMFQRLDVAVLYVNRRYYAITARIIASIYPRVTEALETDTPLFARRLANGLALAESPVVGRSFGINRWAIVAATLCPGYDKKRDAMNHR